MALQTPTPGSVHRIGEAARLSGVPAASIRYYEKEGLLPPQGRTDKQYRLYNEADIHRLRFVRLCRAMDMSLDEVRTRLRELQVLEAELIALRSRCDGQGTCQVIEALHARADATVAPLPAASKRHERHV